MPNDTSTPPAYRVPHTPEADAAFDRLIAKGKGGCRLWEGAVNGGGYGDFYFDGATTGSHRYALERKLGRPVGATLWACHSCPNRNCVAPRHLREGTAQDNADDTISAGRARGRNKTITVAVQQRLFTPTGRKAHRHRKRGMMEADLIVWFWGMVDQHKGHGACWPWAGGLFSSGYGRVGWDGRSQYAHRVSFLLSGGVLTEQKPWVLHLCKQNPACCNPAHLYAGDVQDNSNDMARDGTSPVGDRHGSVTKPGQVPRGERHGRHTKPERSARGDRNGMRTCPASVLRGEANGSAKLTTPDIPLIRSALAGGESQRSVARRLRVGASTIQRIAAGESWVHVP